MPRWAARNSSAAATLSSTGLSATCAVGATCSLSSMRDNDNKSSTSRAMRPACSCIIPRNRSRAAASSRAGPRNVSIKPSRVESGVFSSCPALAMKSARISSARFSAVMSCRLITAAAPSSDGPSMRAIRACSSRVTGTETANSTVRISSPAKTASAAPNTAGLRNAAARSRGSNTEPISSAQAALARTIRRLRSIRISGSGIAAIAASAAPSCVSVCPACSRQSRSSRDRAGHSAWAAGLSGRALPLLAISGPSRAVASRAANPSRRFVARTAPASRTSSTSAAPIAVDPPRAPRSNKAAISAAPASHGRRMRTAVQPSCSRHIAEGLQRPKTLPRNGARSVDTQGRATIVRRSRAGRPARP